MATVKFNISKSNSKESSIYLRLRNGRNSDFSRSTGLIISRKDWSEKTGFPKQNKAENKVITSRLRKLKDEIFDQLNDAVSTGKTINSDWLQFHIDLFFERITLNNRSEYLLDAVKDVINTASTKLNSQGGLGLSKSRIKSYEGLKSILEKYCGTKYVRVKDVDVNFANDFLHWLIEKEKYSQGFALKSIDNLKAVCKDASTKGIQVNDQLKNIKGGRIKNDNIIYLNPIELEIIKNKKLNNERLENARKWLLLGCYIGQRVGDLLNITKENFKTISNLSVIELEQQKTGKLILIPVNQQVKNIFESGLPYKVSAQKFNESIKDLCEVCEINTPTKGSIYKLDKNKVKRKQEGIYPKHELITSHVCRRSFCSNYYGKMPTNLIMQISGHSTEKMLLTYIGKKAPDYIQEIAHYFAIEEQRNKNETNLSVIKGVSR